MCSICAYMSSSKKDDFLDELLKVLIAPPADTTVKAWREEAINRLQLEQRSTAIALSFLEDPLLDDGSTIVGIESSINEQDSVIVTIATYLHDTDNIYTINGYKSIGSGKASIKQSYRMPGGAESIESAIETLRKILTA